MFRRQDLFEKYAGGDGALSKQELEMLQAAQWGQVCFRQTWLGQNKHPNATASLACKGENAHLRQASFAVTWFHVLSSFSCLWFESVPLAFVLSVVDGIVVAVEL